MISSYSGKQGNCIDVSTCQPWGHLAIRETDNPSGVIYTTRESFLAFIRGVKAGDFDYLVENEEQVPSEHKIHRLDLGTMSGGYEM